MKHEGTLYSSSDLLKICVKMRASWTSQVFRQAGDKPSGPGAFLLFFFIFYFFLPGTHHLLLSAYSAVQERGVAGGTNGVFSNLQ